MNIRPENQAYLWPSLAQSRRSEAFGAARAACFEQLAGVFASCGALHYAKILASLKIKNGISRTPLNCALNAFTLALKCGNDEPGVFRTTSMNCPFLWLRMLILLWNDSFRLLSSKKCRFYWRSINQKTFPTFFFCWSHFWSPQCKRWPQNTSKSTTPSWRIVMLCFSVDLHNFIPINLDLLNK